MQMDQVTQQNAALVEEMAAAASSLQNQAADLVQVVAVFKLGAADYSGSGARQRMQAAPKAPHKTAVGKLVTPKLAPRKVLKSPKDDTKALGIAQTKAADKGADDWESF